MALSNPNNLYSGGQVVLDSTPFVNAYKREKAQQEARDIAMDKYYQNLPNTINDKGVRDQEIPVIDEAKGRLQQYWMANKDAIRKGNTPQNFNYQKMIRETAGIIQQSKNRADVANKLSKLRGNPKYDYIFRNPNIISQIDSHELPVTAEGSTGIDFNQLTLPPPPFEQKKYIETFADVKPDMQVDYENNPDDKFTKIEVQTPVLNKEALGTLYQRATTALFNDPSFYSEIKRITQDPETAADLNETFKKTYGREIENEADIAAAYTIKNMPLASKRKNVPDWEAREAYKNQQKKNLLYLQDRLIRGRKQSGQSPEGVDINDVFTGIYDTTQDPNSAINVGDTRIGTRVNALNSDGQLITLEYARKLTGNNELGNDDIFIDAVPDGRIAVYRAPKKKSGVMQPFIKDKSTLIGYLPRVGTNLKAQPSVKEKRKVISQGNSKTTLSSSASKGDLDDLQ